MITSFRSKGLKELFESGSTNKINSKLQAKCERILFALDQATKPEDVNIPGFGFHALRGFDPTRYAVSVNGPWRVTFEFDDENACRLDFEQYH